MRAAGVAERRLQARRSTKLPLTPSAANTPAAVLASTAESTKELGRAVVAFFEVLLEEAAELPVAALPPLDVEPVAALAEPVVDAGLVG